MAHQCACLSKFYFKDLNHKLLYIINNKHCTKQMSEDYNLLHHKGVPSIINGNIELG